MKLFSLFGKKKNNIRFDYAPDLTEYRLFPKEPESVRLLYRFCRISMAAYIPLFIVLSLFSIPISIIGLLITALASFNATRQTYGLKAAFVPVICSATGMLFGFILSRYIRSFPEVFP
jgi:hypothetical protein